MTSKTLFWGFCGAGKIAHDFAVGLSLFSDTEHKIVAVAARNKERLNEFAKTHNIQQTYDNYQAIAHNDQINVVYVNVVNKFHYEIAKCMIEHGKNVLVEKPMCMNTAETETLIKSAKEHKVFLMEALWSRCFPVYKDLEKQLQNGVVGNVKKVTVNLGFPLTEIERINSRDLGGGTVMDLGVYVLQFAKFVFRDSPIEILASGKLNSEGVDISANITLRFSNGEAILKISGENQLDNVATITGDIGMIEIPDFWSPTTIKGPQGENSFPLPETKFKLNFHHSTGLSYEAAEVKRCIDSGLFESPAFTLTDSLVLAQWRDQIRRQLGVVYSVD
ncbi:uncharacterized protein CBL_14330 [Carabus blaptoides fortunei]